MAIVDASVAVKLVTAEPGTLEARDLCFSQPVLHAPDWVLIETASALWGKVMRGELRREDVATLLSALPSFFEPFHAASSLLGSGMELALQLRHHVYDCLYLALAIDKHDRLLTADRKFYNSACRAGLEAHVDLLVWQDGP